MHSKISPEVFERGKDSTFETLFFPFVRRVIARIFAGTKKATDRS